MVPAVEVLLIEDEETDRLLVQELVARRGLMLVLSSPSGAGKTTQTRRLVE